MARKSDSTILQEELYPPPDEPAREEPAQVRSLDLDVEDESPFLRRQRRIPARRGSLPKKTVVRMAWAGLAVGIIFLCGVVLGAVYHYGEHSWRFRIDSSDQIELIGLHNVTRQQVMEVMGGDLGRNIFFVPLSQRQKQLEQIPWVASASIMRFVPNRLTIEIQERTPVAFARVGSKILLVDADGSLMDLPVGAKKKFSFPVILGMNQSEPRSMRAARMKTYRDLVSQLDSDGAHYSQDLSEVDLSDPDDVKVIGNDSGGEVLVHLGSTNYLERYKIYVSHVREWRQQFEKLDSVDLRYDRQVIVNPDLQGLVKQTPLSSAVIKSAAAAGVKPAALVRPQGSGAKAAVTSPAALSPAKQAGHAAAKKQAGKAHHKKAVPHKASAATTAQTPASGVKPAAPVPQAGAARAEPTNSISPNTGGANSGSKPSPAIPKGQQ